MIRAMARSWRLRGEPRWRPCQASAESRRSRLAGVSGGILGPRRLAFWHWAPAARARPTISGSGVSPRQKTLAPAPAQKMPPVGVGGPGGVLGPGAANGGFGRRHRLDGGRGASGRDGDRGGQRAGEGLWAGAGAPPGGLSGHRGVGSGRRKRAFPRSGRGLRREFSGATGARGRGGRSGPVKGSAWLWLRRRPPGRRAGQDRPCRVREGLRGRDFGGPGGPSRGVAFYVR